MSSRDGQKTKEELIRELQQLRVRLNKTRALTGLVHELEVHQEEIRTQNEQLLVAQRELEASRDRYADLYDFAPTAYLTLDKQGLILDINLTGCKLLRRERAKIVGYPFTAFVHPADQAVFRRQLIRSRRNRVTMFTEVRARVDNDMVPVEVAMVPASDVVRPLTIRVVLVDLSERKRAESERRDLMAREESAHAASEAKDRFLAMVSHELRTPLTPILALASTMERNPDLPSDVRSMLEVIRRNIYLEERLINDLLDMNRVSLGKLLLKLEDTDAHAIVRYVVDMSDSVMDERRLHLDLELAADQHWVRGDALRLRQIIWNLLANAVKFTPQGGKVVVRSMNRPGVVVFEVIDNGIGIHPEALERVFSFYEQEGRQPESEMRGLGLGLAIAKALVEAHGGRIHAMSEGVGKGATFQVVLPVIDEPQDAASRASALGTQSRHPGRKHDIILVEDHADTALAMVHLLKTAGHQVTVAHSVGEALSFSERPFDLLISDLDLPDGSGLDVMRHMNSRGHMAGIVVSGFGREEDIRKCYEAGFSVHLTKPLDFDRLIDTIARITAS